MKKKKVILSLIFILIIIIGLLILKSAKPENVIKKSFDYINNKNSERLLYCYTDRNRDVDFRLYNIKKCSLKKVELIKAEKIYNQYFISGLGSINKVSRDDIKIFNIDYYVEYNNDSIEPKDSGEYSKYYFLIKENGYWKIDEIVNQ